MENTQSQHASNETGQMTHLGSQAVLVLLSTVQQTGGGATEESLGHTIHCIIVHLTDFLRVSPTRERYLVLLASLNPHLQQVLIVRISRGAHGKSPSRGIPVDRG